MNVTAFVGSQGLSNPYLDTGINNNGLFSAAGQFMDDFCGKSVNEYVWQKTGAGTAIVEGASANFGRLTMATGAVINQDILMNFNDVRSLGVLYRANNSKLSDFEIGGVFFSSLTDVIARLGWQYDATNYTYCELDPGTRGNDHIWLCTAAGGAESATDTGLSATTTEGSRVCLRFAQTGATDFSLYYKVQNAGISPGSYTLLTTLSASAAIKDNVTWQPYLYIKTLANANKKIYLDYVRATALRVSP